MVTWVVLLSIAVLGAGYLVYGRFVVKAMDLDDSRQTPACQINDGVDYVPAKCPMLLGQHFSAIAAAGPIVGPILAGIWFGWVPALLWIVLGCIFIGAVHDFTSLLASVRHGASSMGEIVRQHMSRTSQVLFLIFIWLALSYVIIAFTDITAQTFRAGADDEAFGPGVAVSSLLYLAIGIGMGVALKKAKVRLWVATAVCFPLVLAAIWLGGNLPAGLSQNLMKMPIKGWEVVLLVYCGIASLLPMWLLLQPRGYLGGWFLYATIAIALLGAIFGRLDVQYPAFYLNGGLASLANGKLLLPFLFITVACGACSGFHGIVSSGTTSKQIARESDTRPVGYGAMILEGVVAVLALATVMALTPGDAMLKRDPNFVYANGLARYMQMVGLDYTIALFFALLAFSTFVYDTLDVATRLARYILQELVGWRSSAGAVVATVVTLIFPLTFLMLSKEKGYLVAWPIFGSSNQLLASLTLLAVSVWLKKTGKNPLFTVLPMAFMLIASVWSLILQVEPMVRSLAGGPAVQTTDLISGIVGVILLGLTVCLAVDAARCLRHGRVSS